MRKIMMASAAMAMALAATTASAEIKLGVIMGFTGPIESLTPGMAAGAEQAMKEVTDSGMLLDGETVTPVRGDSTCVDAAAATAAAERLITSDGVAAIVGADCSGVTTAIANNVAVPNGVVMVSPSATSPALTTIDDNGYFFRVAPSDARQGQVLATIVKERGVKSVAISYTNNDYGKGLAEFAKAFLEEDARAEVDTARSALLAARKAGWIADDALIVWEDNAEAKAPEGFVQIDARRYGDTWLTFLSPNKDAPDAD